MPWNIIAHSRTAFITLYEPGKVLKGHVVYHNGQEVAFKEDRVECERSLRRELEIYQHLKPHPNILSWYGPVTISPGIESLCLEYAAKGDLRTLMQYSEAPKKIDRLRWSYDIAGAVAHLHNSGVVHCDISCRNFFIDSNDVIKVGDFGGSCLEGQQPNAAAESRYQMPLRGRPSSQVPALQEDIFALGSALYEILAWHQPYPSHDEDHIEKLYEAGTFPDLSDIPAANIIARCWTEQYDCVTMIQCDLEPLQSSQI